MSRDFSRPRSNSSVDRNIQRVLNLDSSPGSSRRHGELGENEKVRIPKFSKEVSSDLEDETAKSSVEIHATRRPESQVKPIMPKSIMKRRIPNQQQIDIDVTEVQGNTKCCHPLVNKIRHIADKTLQKLERNDNTEKSLSDGHKSGDFQEIKQLKCSPGASRRQKFGAIKLGDSDEMSKSTNVDIIHPIKNKNHIYEDIEEKKCDTEIFQTVSFADNKSNGSHDPSLMSISIQPEDQDITDKMGGSETKIVEIFENPSDDHISITEIFPSHTESNNEENNAIVDMSPSCSPGEMDTNLNEVEFQNNQQWSRSSRWISEGGSPLENLPTTTREGSVRAYTPDVRCACQFFQCDTPLPERGNRVSSRPTSRVSNIIQYDSDHEYEIIEKPSPLTIEQTNAVQISTGDELSFSNSLNQDYLSQTLDEGESIDYMTKLNSDFNEDLFHVESIQEDTRDKYFTEADYEVSTDQVEPTALDSLSTKSDNKVQHHFKEGTRKVKIQAEKLKTKIHNLKSKQFNMPEKVKINFPDFPSFSLPERSKFKWPMKKNTNIQYRPKKDNTPEYLNIGQRQNLKKRSKYSIPNFSKFVMSGLPKTNFKKNEEKKDYNLFKSKTNEPGSDNKQTDSQFEENSEKSQSFIKSENKTKRDFSFTPRKKHKQSTSFNIGSPVQVQEYKGNLDSYVEDKQIDPLYDFERADPEYSNETDTLNYIENLNETSLPLDKQETSHINEISNDEFFVRPRGISEENIRVREYLIDEIRQAFRTPSNGLLSMGSNPDQEMAPNANDYFRDSNEHTKNDQYYTYPPVRPSRTKHKAKGQEPIKYIDESISTSKEYNVGNFDITQEQDINQEPIRYIDEFVDTNKQFSDNRNDHYDFEDVNILPDDTDIRLSPTTSIHCVEYANDVIVQNPDNITIKHQTDPIPPKRIKRNETKASRHSSRAHDMNLSSSNLWDPEKQTKDIIVYQTQYEYISPQPETVDTEICPVPPRRHRSLGSRGTSLCDEDGISHETQPLTIVYQTQYEYIKPQPEVVDTEQHPVPPRRNRSLGSRGTSLCDIDGTPHETQTLIFDTQFLETGIFDIETDIRYQNSEYATVNKSPFLPIKRNRRFKGKASSARHRRSNSSERKYYTVDLSKTAGPRRPTRKKSTSSLTTFDDFTERPIRTNFKSAVEKDENSQAQPLEEPKNLKSVEIVNKMKDRPLPSPPRPPRGSKKTDKIKDIYNLESDDKHNAATAFSRSDYYSQLPMNVENAVEVEVSTQTDQLPDNVNFELAMIKNQYTPSLKKGNYKNTDSTHSSRPTSEHSFEISKFFHAEPTSPGVILIERNVSSPSRINERDEMLTEASLVVQHIDIRDPQIPHVPPFPKSDTVSSTIRNVISSNENKSLEISDTSREVIIDNLVTQRLHVKDLDVSHLSVSELQAGTLQVSESPYKSGRISESGIELSQSVIDEIVRKFSEITSNQISTSQINNSVETKQTVIKEEQTQTDFSLVDTVMKELLLETTKPDSSSPSLSPSPVAQEHSWYYKPPSRPSNGDNPTIQIPTPPKLTPLLYSYFQDTSLPSASSYTTRSLRERPLTEFNDLHQSPTITTRQARSDSAAASGESSSDKGKPYPPPRSTPLRAHELTITEAGAQFMSVCHRSISRIIKSIFNYCISYINTTDDKKDMQMALVIFLVLIAGLVMFGLSDHRTVHHHHWEFFNPPYGDNQQ